MRRFTRGLALSGPLLLAFAGGAGASEAYPEGIRAHLDIAAAPPCDVCHHAALEPVGAVDRPFGLAVTARGLVGQDDASLAPALDAMRADGVDSDGDGAQDLDELGWGGDPNLADLPEAPLHEAPTYGCGVASRGGEGREGAPLVAAAIVALVLRGRPRRAVSDRTRPGSTFGACPDGQAQGTFTARVIR